MTFKDILWLVGWLVGWLCLTSHRHRGHLETAPPFTVPCEGREARYKHRSDRELNPGPSHGSPFRYRCATKAPLTFYEYAVQPSNIIMIFSLYRYIYC